MNLEELLAEAVTNADRRVDFINALINSEVCVIGAKVDNKESDPNGLPALNMISIKGKDGKAVIPFFSSHDALNLFASKVATGNAPYVKIKCVDFLKIVAGNKSGAVFNLNSQYSKEFPLEEIEALLNSLTQGVAVPNEGIEGNVIIATPKTYPEEFVKAFRKFCGTRLDIVKAYVFDMVYPDTTTKMLLVVDAEFSRPELFDKIVDKEAELLPGQEDTYEIMSAKEPFCQGFIRSQKPFYSKTGN